MNKGDGGGEGRGRSGAGNLACAMIAGPFSFIGDITDRLGDWAANWWFIAVVVAISLIDAVIPVVPSETALILAGVAVSTDSAPYPLWAVIVAGAVGAFLGDNLAYLLGRRFAGAFERRAASHPTFATRLKWAESQIIRRGGPLLITARFIPGGRTVLTIASGITRQRHVRFAAWVLAAAVIWATFSAGLAYLVGRPFKDNHAAAFWVAFGTALTINLVIELIRHRRNRARRAEAVAP